MIITGVSSGIGKSCVEYFSKIEGYSIIACLRGGAARASKINFSPSVQSALQAGNLKFVHLDLNDPSSFQGVLDLATNHFGGIVDCLLHNAATGLMGPAQFFEMAAIRQQFDTNFFGTVELNQKFIPYLLKSNSGKIFCISSIMGRLTMPFYSVYSATKYSLEAYFESLSLELSHQGIRVCMIEPGGVRTDFAKNTTFLPCPEPLKGGPVEALGRIFQVLYLQKAPQTPTHPESIAKIIHRYDSATRIPFRRIIGIDAWFLYFTSRLVPEGLRRWVVSSILKWALGRKWQFLP